MDTTKTVKILGGELPEDHPLVKTGRSIEDGVDLLKSLMLEDYKRWSNIPEDKTASECADSDDIRENMYSDFAGKLGHLRGNKYIKITTGGRNSACGFIVNTHFDKKFKFGDILKAASWCAPARNFPRGNVIEDSVEDMRRGLSWTGPC